MDLLSSFVVSGCSSLVINVATEPFERMYQKRTLNYLSPGMPKGSGELMLERLKNEGVFGVVGPSKKGVMRRSRLTRDVAAFGIKDTVQSMLGPKHPRTEYLQLFARNSLSGFVSGTFAGLTQSYHKSISSNIPISIVCRYHIPTSFVYYGVLFGVNDTLRPMSDVWATLPFRSDTSNSPFGVVSVGVAMFSSILATFASQPFRVASTHQAHKNEYLPTGYLKYTTLPQTLSHLRSTHGLQVLYRGIHSDRILYTGLLLILFDAAKKKTNEIFLPDAFADPRKEY
eukprot:TRINITY_DN8154_c0_g2_i1.p1 TRINITY_DN8154_c0_g2~~TRINITY_DN8154_c0_g2_i1.p1  ORF type:complete len:292 (+),score=4.94 TRINITY_DN8154_c0_g2_i1:23-877(+)